MVISQLEQDELTLNAVHRVLPLSWSDSDYEALLNDLNPYVAWIDRFLKSGAPFPTHIEHSGCIAVPVGQSTTPTEMFAVLGDKVHFTVQEHDEFWITVHYPNPEPVVTLLPKELPGIPSRLVDLCAECSRVLGFPVGGASGMFLAWLMPGFSWAMHTDHDNAYELVAARVHVPLITNADNFYVWGKKDEQGREVWMLMKHLEQWKAHDVRVDVPHTVVNRHTTEPRLHLILDVHE